MISPAAPFDLDFYQRLARGKYETKSVGFLRRRLTNPSFYIQTVTRDTGEEVPADVIAGIARVLGNSVPELSGFRLSVNAIETARDPFQFRQGVTFARNLGGAGGRATRGDESGWIELLFDIPVGFEHAFGCEHPAVAYIDHEILHTMGFYHTGDWRDFQSGDGCPGNGRPDAVRYHAAVAYSRPPGNMDPDTDPKDYSVPASSRQAPAASCSLNEWDRATRLPAR